MTSAWRSGRDGGASVMSVDEDISQDPWRSGLPERVLLRPEGPEQLVGRQNCRGAQKQEAFGGSAVVALDDEVTWEESGNVAQATQRAGGTTTFPTNGQPDNVVIGEYGCNV